MATNDGGRGKPFYFPAVPRRRFVLAVELVHVDGAFLIHIDNGYVAVRAQTDGAFLRIDLPNFCRVFAGDFDVLVQRKSALVDLGKDERNAGLDAAETGDAIPNRRLGELAVNMGALLLQCMG